MQLKENKWLIFIGAGLMIFLANIDATIVNLALAVMAQHLHTNLAQTQWIINSYLLTTTIFFIIGGKLSDIHGVKKIFLIGTLFFGIASFFAGITDNFTVLLLARLLQGIGFAFTLSLAFLLLAAKFPPQQRGFVIGLSVIFTAVGQAVGPTLGGFILEKLSWHWIFLINLPIAALSFIIIFFCVSKEKISRIASMDYSGGVLFAISFGLLLFTLNTLSSHDLNLTLFVAGIVVSAIFFLVFYIKEMRTASPLIDFRLFKECNYTLSLGIRGFFMYAYGNFLFFIPLYLQNVLSYSPLISGLIILVYSFLLAICSPLAGKWSDRSGYKIPIIFGAVAASVAFLFLAIVSQQHVFFFMLIGLALFGIGTGIIIPATVHSTMSSLPKKSAGEGIGMFFTIAFMATSLGVSLSGAQLNRVSLDYLQKATIISSLNETQYNNLHQVSNGTRPITLLQSSFPVNEVATVSQLAKQSFAKGFSSVMLVNLFLTLILGIFAICFKSTNKTPKSL